MFEALKGLFTSKTTWLAVIGSAVLVLASKIVIILGVPPDMQQTILTGIAGLFGLKAFQQASADFGKNSK